MKQLSALLLLFFVLIINVGASERKMIVGVSESPPFVYSQDGRYTGLNVDLWEEIADSLLIDYEYKKYTIAGLISALRNGEIDLCISPLTITASRLEYLNFSVPVYVSDLAFAVVRSEDASYFGILARFFSWEFFSVVGGLFLVILVFGFAVWLFENRKNDDFPKGWRGIFDGVWWSAVTMTTVGYGDKSPKTFGGRFLAVIWMFTAVIIISSFTAGITSSLTVNTLNNEVNELSDLRKIPTGTVSGSSSEAMTKEFHIDAIMFPSVRDGLEAMLSGRIKAFVYDEPILRYYLGQLEMSGDTYLMTDRFYSDYLGFCALDYRLIRKVNPLLIELMDGEQWKQMLTEYGLLQHNKKGAIK